MNMKKLTLLIALSIIIFYLLSPCFMLVAASDNNAVVIEPAIELTIEEEPVVEKEEEIIEYEEEPVIVEQEEEKIYLDVPSVRDFKSYTNYRMLNKKSPQWNKIQTIAYSADNGLRYVDNYICVAMGSFYTQTLGDLFRITTEEGNIFEVIITDFKSDKHTNSTHQYTIANQCILEFYVDMNELDSSVAYGGNISRIDGFEGKIVSIEKIGNYFTK